MDIPFQRQRQIHLLNKLRATELSLRRDLPEEHRHYKVFVLIPLIKKALDKIENSDDYGVCEKCLEEVSAKRLEIRPESDLCVYCQDRKEKAIGE